MQTSLPVASREADRLAGANDDRGRCVGGRRAPRRVLPPLDASGCTRSRSVLHARGQRRSLDPTMVAKLFLTSPQGDPRRTDVHGDQALRTSGRPAPNREIRSADSGRFRPHRDRGLEDGAKAARSGRTGGKLADPGLPLRGGRRGCASQRRRSHRAGEGRPDLLARRLSRSPQTDQLLPVPA